MTEQRQRNNAAVSRFQIGLMMFKSITQQSTCQQDEVETKSKDGNPSILSSLPPCEADSTLKIQLQLNNRGMVHALAMDNTPDFNWRQIYLKTITGITWCFHGLQLARFGDGSEF